MKTRAIFVSAVCWLAFAGTGFSAQNLVLNPGCETVGIPPPSWTQVTGNWVCKAFTPDVPPQGGVVYFVAGDNAGAELRQDVSVSGSATVIDWGLVTAAFQGYVRSWNQTPVDFSRIVVEYRDAANTAVLGSFDSGNLANVGSWKLVADTRTIPVDTRTIRIRLISTRQEGSSNDGYYDDLSLAVTIPKVSCYKDADCRLEGCDTDCSCVALGLGESLPKKCKVNNAACFQSPCRGRIAKCDHGKCLATFI